MKPFMLIFIVLLYLGANVYVFWRLGQIMPGGAVGRLVLAACALVLVASFFASMLCGDSLPMGLASVLYRIGTSWLFILLYLLMALLLCDLLRLTGLLPGGLLGSRTALAVVAAVVAVVMGWGYYRYTDKDRVGITVCEGGGDPLRILAVSDLHLGYGIGRSELEGWVETINAQQPDLVLIAGDVVDNSVRPLEAQRMDEALAGIRARYGVYAIPGNHEYIAGITESIDFLERSGINVLRDTAVLAGGKVWIVGRDDRTNPARVPLGKLLAPLDRTKPVILLDHQPYDLDEGACEGVAFQFSGHTHRGQVWPISLITDALFEDSHGLIQKGSTTVYVSSGLGIWGGKFRIGSRSEYVVVDFCPGD